MENKLNLYQKLHKIQSEIIGLGKDKKAFGYDYVTGNKVLEYIKPLMNDLGLILKQEIISIENTRQDYQTKNGSKSEILSKVMMKFTWVDCETGDKDENMFGSNGQNDWDKGVGSALTYGERYFLLKYFHIATDEDDIDNPERKQQEKEQEDKKAEEQKRQIERYKAETIVKIETTKTEEELKQVWTSIPKEWQLTFKEQVAKQKESFNK